MLSVQGYNLKSIFGLAKHPVMLDTPSDHTPYRLRPYSVPQVTKTIPQIADFSLGNWKNMAITNLHVLRKGGIANNLLGGALTLMLGWFGLQKFLQMGYVQF